MHYKVEIGNVVIEVVKGTAGSKIVQYKDGKLIATSIDMDPQPAVRRAFRWAQLAMEEAFEAETERLLEEENLIKPQD